MFILLGIGLGIVIGLVRGGSLNRLRLLSFRLFPLAIAGLLTQVVLFSDPVATDVSEAVGRLLYTLSTAAVFLAVLANVRVSGIPLVAFGAGLNLLAIVLNGGVMPADPGAVEAAGIVYGDLFSNSAVVPNPVLAPLTDVFAVPAGLPFANVFSIGDVIIALGLAWTVAAAMTRPGATEPADPGG